MTDLRETIDTPASLGLARLPVLTWSLGWIRSAARQRAAFPALVAALVGLACAARSLFLGITLSQPVPSYDSWAFVDILTRFRNGDYGLLDLFEQHNEHRIFTARLNFFADFYLFRLSNVSVVVANYLLLAVLSAVLTGVAAQGRSARVKIVVFFLALATQWSAAGWINLVWSFQIQWAYVHLLPVLAIAAFVGAGRSRGSRRWLFVVSACCCDGLGVYSMSSGLVTLVPVIAVAVWTRTSPKLVLGFILFHAAMTAMFFWGYEPPSQTLVLAPGALMRYVAPYLGTAFPASKAVSIRTGALGFGLALLLLARATWTAVVRRRRIEQSMAILLGVVAFVLTEGLATAFGRAGLLNPTGLALRYGTPSELFWTALTLCVARWLWLTGRETALQGLAVLALVGVLVSNTVGGTVASWHQWSVQNEASAFNLINGVMTDEHGQGLDPLPETEQSRFDLMRDLQLGPFAEQATEFRPPLNSLAGQTPDTLPACIGTLDQFTVSHGRLYHLQGWAVTPGVPVSAAWVLATGPKGDVLGFSKPWQSREDTGRRSGRAVVQGFDFWFLHPSDSVSQAVDLVAVFPGHTVPPCRLPMPAAATDVSPP